MTLRYIFISYALVDLDYVKIGSVDLCCTFARSWIIQKFELLRLLRSKCIFFKFINIYDFEQWYALWFTMNCSSSATCYEMHIDGYLKNSFGFLWVFFILRVEMHYIIWLDIIFFLIYVVIEYFGLWNFYVFNFSTFAKYNII